MQYLECCHILRKNLYQALRVSGIIIWWVSSALAVEASREPIPVLDLDSREKVIIVELEFRGSEVLLKSPPIVVYGVAHTYVGNPNQLLIQLLDEDGAILDYFNSWDPRVIRVRDDRGFTLTQENNVDRPGKDLGPPINLSEPNVELCKKACADEPSCKAYTYVRPSFEGEQARCWLKDQIPGRRISNCCISGVRTNTYGDERFEILEDAIEQFIIPFYPNIAYTSITENNKTIIRMDFRQAVKDFCGKYPKDPDCSLTVTTIEKRTDRPGGDYKSIFLTRGDPELCRRACQFDKRCCAYTYVPPGIQGPQARCWLKEKIRPAVFTNCCTSGIKFRKNTTACLTGCPRRSYEF